MSHKTQRYQTHGVTLRQNCDELERDVANQQTALRQTLRATAEPIVSYPEAGNMLAKEGRTEDLSKLDNLVTTIARDIDHFTAEDRKLSTELEDLRKSRPKKPAHLARYYNQIGSIGHRYIELNEKVLDTTCKLADDYTEIIAPATAAKVRELENQQPQAEA